MVFLYEINYYRFETKTTIYAYGKTTVEEARYWLLLDDKKNTVVCIKFRDFISAVKIRDTLREVPPEDELTKDFPQNVQAFKSVPRPNSKIPRNNRTKTR